MSNRHAESARLLFTAVFTLLLIGNLRLQPQAGADKLPTVAFETWAKVSFGANRLSIEEPGLHTEKKFMKSKP